MTAVVNPAAPLIEVPKFYLVALREAGVRESAGDAANPRILEYLATTQLPRSLKASDETAWCSAFVNWCVVHAGGKGTGAANARSWLTWGKELTELRVGAVLVFSRDSAGPASGHVAFCDSAVVAAGEVLTWGGNQANRVGPGLYERSTLLSIRWPS